jgi:hypothetical protein
MTITNTAALSAHFTMKLPKPAAFSNDTIAKRRSYTITVKNPVIYCNGWGRALGILGTIM